MVDWILGASLLIVLMLLIRCVFRGKISFRLQYAMWAIVLIRLLCPIGLWDSSEAGAWLKAQGQNVTAQWNLVGEEYQEYPVTWQQTETEPVRPMDGGKTDSRSAAKGEQTKTMDWSGDKEAQVLAEIPGADDAESFRFEALPVKNGNGAEEIENDFGQNQSRSSQQFLLQMLPILWGLGSLAAFGWILYVNVSYSRQLKRSRVLLVNGNITSCLPVYVADSLNVPCLFGLFHPAVYLTNDACREEETAKLVIIHEECHYRHGDHLWGLVRGLCLAVWWWNPLVWAAAICAGKDSELACDEAVMKRIGWESRFGYAKALVDVASGKRTREQLFAPTMASNHKDMKRRLCMIFQKTGKQAASMAMALTLVLGSAVFCFGESADQTEQGASLPVLCAETEYVHEPTTDGVQEFCARIGLQNSGDLYQITPVFMKDTEIRVFEDSWNHRIYVEYQGEAILVWESGLSDSFTSYDNVLNMALADTDSNGSYELFLLLRNYKEFWQEDAVSVTGMRVISCDLSTKECDYHVFLEEADSHSPAKMLCTDEDGGLLLREAAQSLGELSGTWTLSDAGKYSVERLSDGTKYADGTKPLEIISDLQRDGWLFPCTENDLRFGDSVETIEEKMKSVPAETKSGDGSQTCFYENVSLYDCRADLLLTVDDYAGLVKMEYTVKGVLDPYDSIRAELIKRLGSWEEGTGENGQSVVWNGMEPRQLSVDGQKQLNEITNQLYGTGIADPSSPMVWAEVTMNSEGTCLCVYEAKPELVLLYRSLVDERIQEEADYVQNVLSAYPKLSPSREIAVFSLGYSDVGYTVAADDVDEAALWELGKSVIDQVTPFVHGGLDSLAYLDAAICEDAIGVTLYFENTPDQNAQGLHFVIREDGSGTIRYGVGSDGSARMAAFHDNEAMKEWYQTFLPLCKEENIIDFY